MCFFGSKSPRATLSSGEGSMTGFENEGIKLNESVATIVEVVEGVIISTYKLIRDKSPIKLLWE